MQARGARQGQISETSANSVLPGSLRESVAGAASRCPPCADGDFTASSKLVHFPTAVASERRPYLPATAVSWPDFGPPWKCEDTRHQFNFEKIEANRIRSSQEIQATFRRVSCFLPLKTKIHRKTMLNSFIGAWQSAAAFPSLRCRQKFKVAVAKPFIHTS